MNENDLEARAARSRGGVWLYPGLLLLTWLVWGWVTRLGILGWDSYPLIAAGRVASIGEVFGTLGEELMDGRYPLGHFWRPLVHWSFGLNHGLHGVDALGYHLMDLSLLAAVACLIAQLGRRWSLKGSWLAGGLAGLLWILHPVQLEVLSVPARRAETLAILFTLWALNAALRHPALSAKRSLWVGLLCACALGSKETGIIALPLVVCAVLLSAPGRAAALRSLLPAMGLLALTFLGRMWVLGGIGGSEASSLALGLPSSSPYLGQLLFPSPGLGVPNEQVPTSWMAIGLPLTLVVLLIGLRGKCGTEPGLFRHLGGGRPSGEINLVRYHTFPSVLLIVWFALLASVTAMAGIEQSWYALPFLVPLSLWIGLLGEAAWLQLKHSNRQRLMLALGGLLLCLALVAQTAKISVLGSERRDLLTEADQDSGAFLYDFSEKVRTDPESITNEWIYFGGDQPPGIFMGASFEWSNQKLDDWREPKMRVHTYALYSLRALAHLLAPDRNVSISFADDPRDAYLLSSDETISLHIMLMPPEDLREFRASDGFDNQD